ncbi:PLC-like phosphodiesterase [Crassisporium funariophilum]|nr:PLC-like phosphodiesterase [Crassisporium funariophilum]
MILSLHLLSVLVLSLASYTNGLYLLRKRATVCNGRSELCNRPYGNTTFMVAHNSFGYSSNPFALARNQAVDVPSQLKIGARTLQGQAHMKDGKLHFCHSTCSLFDGGLVLDYLKKVKTFLDANPYEVFTFIFTNPGRHSPSAVWKPIFDEAGISPLAYVPPSRLMKRSDWPTLSQLLDANKRFIVFMDEGADGSVGPTVDFILPQFEMIWEDPFSPTNKNFPCSIHRTRGSLSNDDHMHLINHNLNANIIPIGDGVLISDFINAPTTNGLTSILAHANGCAKFSQGRAPNFVLLDYINVGETMKAVNRLNGF